MKTSIHLVCLVAFCLSLVLTTPNLAVSQTKEPAARRLVRTPATRLARPSAKPAAASFTSTEFALHQKLGKEIDQHFDKHDLPGLVVLYARDGGMVFQKTLGICQHSDQAAHDRRRGAPPGLDLETGQ